MKRLNTKRIKRMTVTLNSIGRRSRVTKVSSAFILTTNVRNAV